MPSANLGTLNSHWENINSSGKSFFTVYDSFLPPVRSRPLIYMLSKKPCAFPSQYFLHDHVCGIIWLIPVSPPLDWKFCEGRDWAHVCFFFTIVLWMWLNQYSWNPCPKSLFSLKEPHLHKNSHVLVQSVFPCWLKKLSIYLLDLLVPTLLAILINHL